LSLAPGDSIVLHFDEGGRVGPPERAPVQWTPLDVAAARHLSGQPIPDAPVPNAEPLPQDLVPEVPSIVPGEIRMRFHDIAGRHTMLVIENGYGRALVFRARLTTAGRTAPTDVCLVRPNNRSFEHWPEAIIRIELSQLVQVDWREGDPVPCR
jgi:hypothetical protein